MDIHISVNITIRNMFMSCRQVALSKLTENCGHFDVCLFQITSCFLTGTARPGALISYEPMSCCLSRKINTSEKNQN